MKGTIFKAFEMFVETVHGDDALDDLLDDVELETEGPFVGPGTYPASDLVALVVAVSGRSGVSVDQLLFEFGRFAFPGLARSVPQLMEQVATASEFLMGIETLMHTEVRKIDPEAQPARFRVHEVTPGELELFYESDLGLFGFVEGLLVGVGDWFGVDITSERFDVDGTNAGFRVTIAGAGQEAA